MGHCYSLDLRVRVADFVDAGHSCRAAAQHFDVSESFAIKLVQRKRRFGSPAPARQGRPPGRGKLVPYESFLIETVEARPAITMPELAARLRLLRDNQNPMRCDNQTCQTHWAVCYVGVHRSSRMLAAEIRV